MKRPTFGKILVLFIAVAAVPALLRYYSEDARATRRVLAEVYQAEKPILALEDLEPEGLEQLSQALRAIEKAGLPREVRVSLDGYAAALDGYAAERRAVGLRLPPEAVEQARRNFLAKADWHRGYPY